MKQEASGQVTQTEGSKSMSKTLNKTLSKKSIKATFENPYEVIFVADGANVSLKSTKSVRLDISKYIMKYISSEFHMTPEKQEEFNKRTYLEIMEECSKHMTIKKKYETNKVP